MSTVILVVWERIELSLRAYETQVSTKLPHRIGEGGENRTLTHGFGDRSSTVELHQHGGVGEIRTHDFTDLQSVPLGHSSTTPY